MGDYKARLTSGANPASVGGWNGFKGLSPWLRERMMLRAFPLLEGPGKARAAL